jgi:hypothetical protein
VTRQEVNQSGACPCGKSTVYVSGPPIGRFLCHCQICQSIYKQPFADVITFWASAVSLPREDSVKFKRYRPPPALRRGTCASCSSPVAGFLRVAPFMRLAFVPSRNFPASAGLPLPSTHIFYHRRLGDALDSLPKISGYWSSELAVAKIVLGSMLHGSAGA